MTREYEIAKAHRDLQEKKLADWCAANAYAITGHILHGNPLTTKRRHELNRLSQKLALAQLELVAAHSEATLVSAYAQSAEPPGPILSDPE